MLSIPTASVCHCHPNMSKHSTVKKHDKHQNMHLPHMQCRLEAMHVSLHDLNAMVVSCAGGSGQLPTYVQPSLRLLDTCSQHTRQVLHTLLHTHSSQHTQQSALYDNHCGSRLSSHCVSSHRHFHAKHRLHLLTSRQVSCACLLPSINSCVVTCHRRKRCHFKVVLRPV